MKTNLSIKFLLKSRNTCYKKNYDQRALTYFKYSRNKIVVFIINYFNIKNYKY